MAECESLRAASPRKISVISVSDSHILQFRKTLQPEDSSGSDNSPCPFEGVTVQQTGKQNILSDSYLTGQSAPKGFLQNEANRVVPGAWLRKQRERKFTLEGSHQSVNADDLVEEPEWSWCPCSCLDFRQVLLIGTVVCLVSLLVVTIVAVVWLETENERTSEAEQLEHRSGRNLARPHLHYPYKTDYTEQPEESNAIQGRQAPDNTDTPFNKADCGNQSLFQCVFHYVSRTQPSINGPSRTSEVTQTEGGRKDTSPDMSMDEELRSLEAILSGNSNKTAGWTVVVADANGSSDLGDVLGSPVSPERPYFLIPAGSLFSVVTSPDFPQNATREFNGDGL